MVTIALSVNSDEIAAVRERRKRRRTLAALPSSYVPFAIIEKPGDVAERVARNAAMRDEDGEALRDYAASVLHEIDNGNPEHAGDEGKEKQRLAHAQEVLRRVARVQRKLIAKLLAQRAKTAPNPRKPRRLARRRARATGHRFGMLSRRATSGDDPGSDPPPDPRCDRTARSKWGGP